MVDQADLLVDDGKLDEALALYGKANARAKDHPLIVLGRSLGRAEASIQNDETFGDLSVKLSGELPSRLRSYRELAMSIANYGLQDFVKAKEALTKAISSKHPPVEPRFWARIAWVHYTRGDLVATTSARGRVVWFGAGKAEDDPTVQLVDAALLLAAGLPDRALALADRLAGIRAQIVRAYADLDLGKPRDAVKEAEAALKKAPDNIEVRILREQARMVAGDGKDRSDATEALEKLARAAKSKIGRHALGMAHYLTGNFRDAESQLVQAVNDVSEDAPNPLAYRSYTALADIALSNGDFAGAGKYLDAALKANSGYFPARVLQAKTVLRHGEPDRALSLLRPMFTELQVLPATMQLIYNEALGTRRGATPADKRTAIEALQKLKDQLPLAELARVAAAIDPKLAKELGLADPAEAVRPATDRRKRR